MLQSLALRENSTTTGTFVNDGPLAWTTDYLDTFGIQPGKSIYDGPSAFDVDKKQRLSTQDAAKQRNLATQRLTNISEQERDRRRLAGTIAVLACVGHDGRIRIVVRLTGRRRRNCRTFYSLIRRIMSSASIKQDLHDSISFLASTM